jgi:hypothetical protein
MADSGIGAQNAVPPVVSFPQPFVQSIGPTFISEEPVVPQVFGANLVDQLAPHGYPSSIFVFIPPGFFVIP